MREILLYILLLTSSIYSCQHNEHIKILKPEYPEIIDILSEVYLNSKYQYDEDKIVFLVYIEEKDINKYELKITILYKEDFSWVLKNKNNKPFGSFEFNKYPVLVFGKFLNALFSYTGKLIQYDWLKEINYKKSMSKKVEEPPIIFEPEVWVYLFKEGSFYFEKKGFNTIFD